MSNPNWCAKGIADSISSGILYILLFPISNRSALQSMFGEPIGLAGHIAIDFEWNHFRSTYCNFHNRAREPFGNNVRLFKVAPKLLFWLVK